MDNLKYRGSTYSLASTSSDDSDAPLPRRTRPRKSHHVFPQPSTLSGPSTASSDAPRKTSPKMSSLLTALRRLSFQDEAKKSNDASAKRRPTHRRANSAATLGKTAPASASTSSSGLSGKIKSLELHRSNSLTEAFPATRTRKREAEDDHDDPSKVPAPVTEPRTPPNPIPPRKFLERRAWSERRASLPRIITIAPVSRPSSPSSASSSDLLPPSPVPSFPPFTPIETSPHDIAVLAEETTFVSEGINISDPSFFLVPTTCDKRRGQDQPEENPLRPIKKLKHLNGKALPAANTFLSTRDHLMPTAIDIVEFIKARGGRCTEGEVFLRFRTGESEHVRSVVNVILDQFGVVKVGSDRRRWILLKTDSVFV